MMAESRRWTEGLAFVVLFCLTTPIAYWMTHHVGTRMGPDGLCLLPVAPGLYALSGSTMIGAALVLRDLVQRRLGIEMSVAAILIGAGFTGLFAPLPLVTASATAYLMSEIADLAIYTPLARDRFVAAVGLSSLVGLVIDSLVFLMLLQGSLGYFAGQVVAKTWVVVLALPLMLWLRRRDERLGLVPA